MLGCHNVVLGWFLGVLVGFLGLRLVVSRGCEWGGGYFLSKNGTPPTLFLPFSALMQTRLARVKVGVGCEGLFPFIGKDPTPLAPHTL
jgi:hypothetical protein